MAYNMVSPTHYPFRRENAKFFSQELIENVLLDFGHIWKPVRSKRETQLRKVASFVFIPPIGRLVAYISRKYSGFIVMKSFKTWSYINSHRPSIRERLLCNEIATFCTRHELEEDDLGLFTFLAIVVEYARLAITHEQESLVDSVVDALCYCLSSKIPAGFVPTLDRLTSRSLNFKYPRNYVICDYDPQTQFVSPVSTDMMYTPKSEFDTPIMLEFHFPASLLSTPPEEIVNELKNRKVHREIFRLKMMTDRATQTEIRSDHSTNQLRCVVFRSDKADLAEKIEIKNDNFDTPNPEATFRVVEVSDVSVQTWSSGEQFDKLHTENDKAEAKKRELQSKGAYSASKHALDLNAVIEKLKTLEKLQIEGPLPSRSHSDVTSIQVEKPEDEKIESVTTNVSTPSSTDFVTPLEHGTDTQSFVQDTCRNTESMLLLPSQVKCAAEKDSSTGASFNDSQFESLDVSSDDPTKIGDEHYSRKDYSFDSQIGSLDESIRTSDESRLEN